jgi:hypothetical protein
MTHDEELKWKRGGAGVLWTSIILGTNITGGIK